MDLRSAFRIATLGPAYQLHKRLIDESRSWTQAQTAEYQTRKISNLLGRYGDSIRSKEHYRANLHRYTTLPLRGLTRRVSTGGTTGTPFTFYADTFARRQKERAYIFDIWSEVGYKPFDLRVVYRGNTGKRVISYNWLENAYVISPAQFSLETVESVINVLRRLPPFFLHVYPSSLLSLLELLGEETMRSLPIRGILAGSEAFPPIQMLAIERNLDIQISHWYGHSEYATLAKYCKDCSGFHFYPTYGYTEFVKDGTELPHIVATSFNSIGTHFVRYDTGDVALLSERHCQQPYQRIDTVVGRVQDYFVGRDGVRYAFGPFLFGIHNQFWELIKVSQFIQRTPGILDVRISFKATTSLADRRWVKDFLVGRFSVVNLTFSDDQQIISSVNGKHRYYINELQF